MAMTLTEAAQFRDLQQQVDALTALVRSLAGEIDALKAQQQQPRRGRPPKEQNGDEQR